jgi:hypothetical protein
VKHWSRALVVVASLSAFVDIARGYTGGPVRAQVDGIDLTEQKVFYHLDDYSEAGNPPQIWYFDLNSAHPTQALRDRSLEAPPGSMANMAWANVSHRLTRLRGEDKFNLEFTADAESVGVDSALNAPIYDLHIHIQAGAKARDVRLQAFCDPLVRVQGIYRIPGRDEEIVVISRIGRVHGCEEVELPVLLPGKER